MSTSSFFEIENLKVSVEGKEILKGLNLSIRPGEVHAIMGRNGAGKTTLSYTLMGHPKYEVTAGKIFFQGKDITEMPTYERARERIFLAFQHPVSIPGVTVANFLRSSIRNVRKDELPAGEVRKKIKEEIQKLGIPESFMNRFVNDGFSGGEKKRLETLQMRLLDPKFSILDETDSGLDIDALKTVSESVQSLRNSERSFLVITHYQRMLDYLKPDVVHVLLDGRIVKTGGPDLAKELENRGYDWVEA